jgi:hypothetical protein
MSIPVPGKAEQIIAVLHGETVNTFNELLQWFGKESGVISFMSSREAWKVEEVLEHVMLANRYLLLLIEKGAKKAMMKYDETRINQIMDGYELSNPTLEEIGVNNSFEWNPPAHMIPSGSYSINHVQQEIIKQKSRILELLKKLKRGEGVLFKMHMSVHSLGKLDVYQYIYFLLNHMRRHIQQMTIIESEHEGFAT